MCLKLTKDEVIIMQKIVSDRIGGSSDILDENMLESSVEAPFAEFWGEERYKGVMEKAARYVTAFDEKQVFADGNKRVSVSTMLCWLARNGYKCNLSAYQLHELMIDLANHQIKGDVEVQLADILERNTTKMDENELAGMSLEEMMNSFLETYEETYIMLSKGPDDKSIEIWTQEHKDEIIDWRL